MVEWLLLHLVLWPSYAYFGNQRFACVDDGGARQVPGPVGSQYDQRGYQYDRGLAGGRWAQG